MTPPICSFCTKTAVSSYLVRSGKMANPYKDIDPRDNPDNSKLEVVKVCEAHREQVPK